MPLSLLKEFFSYQNADRLPLLTSRPVPRWKLLVKVVARNMPWPLRPRLVEHLNTLVVRSVGIGAEVDKVCGVLSTQARLVGSTGDLVQLLHC